MPERTPAPGGPLDRRLGVSSKAAACGTCGLRLADCAGHFGYIKLELPVFHIGYFRTTIQILQCICKRCARVLLPPEELASWLRRFRRPGLERAQREAMFRRVLDLCKRVRVCPHCGEWNGVVK
jgi:DNA-directed RNA polymerase III subunit RPC1